MSKQPPLPVETAQIKPRDTGVAVRIRRSLLDTTRHCRASIDVPRVRAWALLANQPAMVGGAVQKLPEFPWKA